MLKSTVLVMFSWIALIGCNNIHGTLQVEDAVKFIPKTTEIPLVLLPDNYQAKISMQPKMSKFTLFVTQGDGILHEIDYYYTTTAKKIPTEFFLAGKDSGQPNDILGSWGVQTSLSVDPIETVEDCTDFNTKTIKRMPRAGGSYDETTWTSGKRNVIYKIKTERTYFKFTIIARDKTNKSLANFEGIRRDTEEKLYQFEGECKPEATSVN